ncbi:MAG: redoxin domain-containing protein [Gammaproteobacteria bacterium]|nr:redoxin domain-containing protein [Gammaproteobacteria bacterium]
MESLELKVPYWIDANGQPTTFSLVKNRGKWIIINCFQHWCEGCHIDGLPDLKIISTAFVDNPNIKIICIQTVFEGFETNTKDRLRENQLQYELPIIMGHDAGDSDGNVYPSTMTILKTGGTPWMIVINPEGKIIFSDFRINVDSLITFLKQETV